jgi:hypothetical protein
VSFKPIGGVGTTADIGETSEIGVPKVDTMVGSTMVSLIAIKEIMVSLTMVGLIEIKEIMVSLIAIKEIVVQVLNSTTKVRRQVSVIKVQEQK